MVWGGGFLTFGFEGEIEAVAQAQAGAHPVAARVPLLKPEAVAQLRIQTRSRQRRAGRAPRHAVFPQTRKAALHSTPRGQEAQRQSTTVATRIQPKRAACALIHSILVRDRRVHDRDRAIRSCVCCGPRGARR